MPNKVMLLDAAHPEETRVALVDERNRLIEYDFESSTKQTIKGNIYLAKVMRVEPSLQAAFVEYGGNRHGFLAFSEIHPDYFRIPVSDRQALSAQLYEASLEEEEAMDTEEAEETSPTLEESETGDDAVTLDFEQTVSTIAGESIEPMDDLEAMKIKRPPLHRLYKIQEVIHKNQIILVQVVKEERAQKGAALTTYLSLAGRYSVLMPNSPHGGGISRKISNAQDRKRLRKILESLNVPKEMGLIIRTAGKDNTKSDLKRDTDYLMGLWDEIRHDTLQAIAPALIYQEDNIIKRAIRDLYTKDVTEIRVEGAESYKAARTFMKKLMPSHAKKVVAYKEAKTGIFTHHKIEKQIEAMHSSVVNLPSGGSIVLHPTEALVSIDINSGRSTRERSIESTALNTNLEAAVEVARQVRLRDLAGLIVIDFIDMDDRRHIQQVERKIREAFRDDRARVQMSKISPFGLLELSRQRLRPSILETSSAPCPHCQATGYIRSVESMALQVLRTLAEEGASGRNARIKVQVPTQLGWYLLNEKRLALSDIERQHDLGIFIETDNDLIIPHYRIIQVERRGREGNRDNASKADAPKLLDREKNKEKENQNPNPRNQKQGHKEANRANQQKQSNAKGQGSPTPDHNAPEALTTPEGSLPKSGPNRNRNQRRRQRDRRGPRSENEGAQKDNQTPAQPDTIAASIPSSGHAGFSVEKPMDKKMEEKPTTNQLAEAEPVAELPAASGSSQAEQRKRDKTEPRHKRPRKNWLKRLLDTE